MRMNAAVRGLLAAAALSVAGAAAQAQETMRISSWLEPHAMNKVLFPAWIEAIEEATEGRVTGKIEFGMAPPPGQLDLITDGSADATWIFHGYNPGRFVATKLVELPGYHGDAEAASVAYWEAHEQFLSEANEHQGVVVAAMMTHGPGQLYMREEIAGLDDLQGKKIRIGGGVSADVGEALGVVGVQVPAPEVYETLSQGVADGVMMPTETNGSLRLYEVAPVTYLMPGGLYRGSFAIIMSQHFLDRLSEEDREAVLSTTGRTLSQMAGNAWAEADLQGLEAIEEHTEVHEFSSEDQAKFADIAESVRQKVIEEVSATGIDAEGAVELIDEITSSYSD
ncbi:MAG: TRAP transporter substrate-binding protein [Hyphomicrobiales bacterium]